MYKGNNPDHEEDLIEWIDEVGEDEVMTLLAKEADKKYGGKPIGERPSVGWEAYADSSNNIGRGKKFLSRDVKNRGYPDIKGDYDASDLYDKWDSQIYTLSEMLNVAGIKGVETMGRSNGHWGVLADVYEVIDGLFDYTEGEGGYKFTPNEFFDEFCKMWDEMIKSNESIKNVDQLYEGKERPYDMGSVLKEGAALEYLKDIAAGETPPITAADVAPAKPDPTIDYDETKDPEMMEGSNQKITESVNRLMEVAMTDAARIRGFMTSPGPKSYDAFIGSKFGDDAISEGKFKTYIQNQLKRGDYVLEPEDEATIFARKAPGGGGAKGAPGGGKGDDAYFSTPTLSDNYKKSQRLTGMEKKYAGMNMDAESSGNADEMFQNMVDIVADISAGVATKRHALIFGDPGIGKTYECTRALEKNLNHDKYEMKYYKGNVGKSITACAAFFYKYSQGFVIMLDDNDAMLMKSGVSQQVKLFFKALLDPDALGQPIAVPTTVLKMAGNALSELAKEGAKPPAGAKKKKEGVLIEIDKQRLREGRLVIHADGRTAVDEFIPLQEAEDLLNILKDPKPIRESRIGNKYFKKPWEMKRLTEADDDDDDFISDEELEDAERAIKGGRKSRQDEDDDYDPNAEELDPNEMPPSFVFNSSVIFISNLEKADIDEAVWDRFTTARIALNPMEFMDRLSKIYPHLGNVNAQISSVPQDYVDWAKKSVLGIMEGIVEAWQTQTPLLGVTVKIPRRTLTFRLFSDLVEFFLRTARSYDRSVGGRGGNFKDKAYQQKVAENVELPLLKFALKKIVFQE